MNRLKEQIRRKNKYFFLVKKGVDQNVLRLLKSYITDVIKIWVMLIYTKFLKTSQEKSKELQIMY